MNGFKVKDIKGNVYENIPIKNIPTIVFYLSNTCSSCVNVLENFERIEAIFKNNYLSYVFLWYDKIPSKVIDKYNINEDWCYQMVGDTKLTTATPTFFILDCNNKVEYFNSDANLMIKKILTLDELKDFKDELIKNTTEFILSRFVKENDNKKICIFFTSEDCHSCKIANQFVESNEVKNLYNVVKIYMYSDMDNSHIKDTYGIFESIYNIASYPRFLLIDDNGCVTIRNELPLN